MLQSEGIISVSVKHRRIVLDLNNDFIHYYKWLIQKEFWWMVDSPLHGSHITIASERHNSSVNWGWAYKQYHRKVIQFSYDENIIIGGWTKGFKMFYVKVFSSDIDKIKNDIGVRDSEHYLGLHCTLGSIGKSGNMLRPYWPQGITIK